MNQKGKTLHDARRRVPSSAGEIRRSLWAATVPLSPGSGTLGPHRVLRGGDTMQPQKKKKRLLLDDGRQPLLQQPQPHTTKSSPALAGWHPKANNHDAVNATIVGDTVKTTTAETTKNTDETGNGNDSGSGNNHRGNSPLPLLSSPSSSLMILEQGLVLTGGYLGTCGLQTIGILAAWSGMCTSAGWISMDRVGTSNLVLVV